jgi:hypothetical protein
VRLGRRAGARLGFGPGLAAELRVSGRIAPPLGTRLVVRGAESLQAAIEDLDADAAALAALLARRGVAPRLRHLVLPPLVAAARAFAARGTGRAPWQRWTLGVLGGYRALVAYAKLWEIRQAEGSIAR